MFLFRTSFMAPSNLKMCAQKNFLLLDLLIIRDKHIKSINKLNARTNNIYSNSNQQITQHKLNISSRQIAASPSIS